ncbi:MAG TPA: acyltransferase [Acidimicrobiales bacterium]|nr:acyltransferase [Acidimicrobiales bacterium]
MGGSRDVNERVEEKAKRLLYRVRRRRFILRLHLLARWRRTDLSLSVAPSVRLGRDVRVRIAPRSTLEVSIGRGSQIFGAQLNLFAGRLHLGPDVQVRPGVVVTTSGDLSFEGSNVLSWGSIVHCGERVSLAWGAGAAEYASIVDSGHFYTEPDVFWMRNTVTAPVVIGKNTFLAPRSTVNRGVTIGDYCVIGPGSVVVKDVPSGMFVSGVPAKEVGPVDLPWERASS